MKLFNTLTRQVEEFVPLQQGEVKLYCCGPTVYDYAHIGNFRTYIWQDILRKTLEHAGYKVTHVMNITDVGHLTSDGDEGEDKMMVAAKRVTGNVSTMQDVLDIARFYEDAFLSHAALLRITKPHIVARASEHITEIIDFVQTLKAKGFAYEAGNNIYFDTAKFPDYGKMARLDIENLRHGARVAEDSLKRNATDFVLWFTKSKFENQLLVWDSPFGVGYPGWHIECSVMASKYLGARIDIHCGGIDFIQVHHTNEIAQSEAYFGHKWVNFWIHGEFINFNNVKFGKSLGNAVNSPDLLEKGYRPEAYRHLVLTSVYRKPMNFNFDALDSSQSFVDKLNKKFQEFKNGQTDTDVINPDRVTSVLAEFWGFLENDLATPRALAVLNSVLKDKEFNNREKVLILQEMNDAFRLLYN